MAVPVDPRLSQISTAWTVLFQAHGDDPEIAREARRQLLHAYGTPTYRYLLAVVRDPDLASDMYQEFALKFVRGDFRLAHPERGRFRDYLKTTLRHLVQHDRHKRFQAPRSLPEQEVAAPPDSGPACDDAFLDAWRQDLLDRAWEGLARFEQTSQKPLHTLLRLRVENPGLQAPQLAERMSVLLRREVPAGWVRKHLHHARDRFVAFLVQQVESTLENPTPGAVQEEFIELGLFEHCRSALERTFAAPTRRVSEG